MKVGAGIKFDILTKTFFFHTLFISTPPPFPLLLYTLSVFWKFLSRFLWYHFLLISLCLFFFHTMSTNFVPHSFSMLHVSSRENLESRWRKHIKNSSNFKSCFAVLWCSDGRLKKREDTDEIQASHPASFHLQINLGLKMGKKYPPIMSSRTLKRIRHCSRILGKVKVNSLQLYTGYMV